MLRTATSDIEVEARARTMYTPIHNTLTDWLIELWCGNNRDVQRSAWLTAICEGGSIDELKEAIREQAALAERKRCVEIVMTQTQWPQRGLVVDKIRNGKCPH